MLLHVSIDLVSKRGSSYVYTSMCYYMLVLICSLREGAVMCILVCVITCYYMLVLMLSLREGAIMYILVCVTTC